MAWMSTHGVRNYEGIWKLSRFHSVDFAGVIRKNHYSNRARALMSGLARLAALHAHMRARWKWFPY